MSKEDLIKKWLSNDLTPSELDEFKKSDDYELNIEILEGAKHFKASHFSKVPHFSSLKKRLSKSQKPVKQLISYKSLLRIAAIFIIGIGVYFTFFFTNLTTHQTLASQQQTFELPDASVVTLNAHSKVTYNKPNWSDNRELTLNGEAFFQVAKGSKFSVNTTEGIVSVLGTQFTVKQRESYFEVICFEGLVGVLKNGQVTQLAKGESYRFLNGMVSLKSTIKNTPEWLNNITNFKSVPYYEVLNELERQYDIEIVTKNIDKKTIFTGGFIHNNLDEALRSISVPLDITYKKESENKIILSKSK